MTEIIKKELYHDDNLQRREFVQKMIRNIKGLGNAEEGCTLLLSGQFGSGKSTVLRYLKEEINLSEDMDVVEYNCWKNNYFENPMIPMLNAFNKLESTINELKNGGIKVLKRIAAIGLGTLENCTKIAVGAKSEEEIDFFADIDEFDDAINNYKKILEKACKKKKIVLLIDEIDRCLPEYQIKILENIHHLLGVTNLVVVIAIDKKQLETTIKRKFGSDNVFGYLSKFVDYEIALPNLNDEQFFKSQFTIRQDCIDTCISMYRAKGLSVRDSLSIIKKTNLYYICKFGGQLSVNMVNFILILRENYNNIYLKYFKVEFDISDYIYDLKNEVDLSETKYIEFTSMFKDDFILKLFKKNIDLFSIMFSILNCIEINKKVTGVSVLHNLQIFGDVESGLRQRIENRSINSLNVFDVNEIIRNINDLF